MYLAHIQLVLIGLYLLFFGSVDNLPFEVLAVLTFAFALVVGLSSDFPRRYSTAIGAVMTLAALTTAWVLSQNFLAGFGANQPADTVADGYRAAVLASRSDNLANLPRIIVPLTFFATALLVSISDRRAIALVRNLGYLGSILIAIGLFQYFLTPDYLLLSTKQFYIGALTIVFVNHNTAATFAGLVLLILLAIATDEYDAMRIDQEERRQAIVSTRGRGRDWLLYLVVGLVAMSAVALMLTKSRGGVLASVVAIAYFVACIVTRRVGPSFDRYRRLSSTILWISVVVAVAAIALLFAGQVVFRALSLGFDDPRFCVWPGIVRAISDNWLMGVGIGGFEFVFPAYRDAACGIDGVWDRAHDVYLEGMLALGIFFPAALVASVGFLLHTLRTGIRQRNRLRHYPTLGVAALILVAGHSLVDFSLQITGFNVFFATLVGALCAICLGRRTVASPTSEKQ